MLCRSWRRVNRQQLQLLEQAAASAFGVPECACPEHASTSMQAGTAHAKSAAGRHAWPHAMPFSSRHLASSAQPEHQPTVAHHHQHSGCCSDAHGTSASGHHAGHSQQCATSPISNSQGSTPSEGPPLQVLAADSSQGQAQVTAAPTACSTQQGVNITTSELTASKAGGYATGVTTLPTGHGFKKTFYKRKLPSPPAIEFASLEGGLTHV